MVYTKNIAVSLPFIGRLLVLESKGAVWEQM